MDCSQSSTLYTHTNTYYLNIWYINTQISLYYNTFSVEVSKCFDSGVLPQQAYKNR
jgi:hypothetical protein